MRNTQNKEAFYQKLSKAHKKRYFETTISKPERLNINNYILGVFLDFIENKYN